MSANLSARIVLGFVVAFAATAFVGDRGAAARVGAAGGREDASRVAGGHAAKAASGGAAGAASEDWASEVRQRIAAAEYEVTWQERPLLRSLQASWHAPNRAQGLRTYFTARGIRVIPRSEETPSWEWGLALSTYGRGHRGLAVEAARLAPSGNRITYDRGTVAEWYLNDPRGLEQGFTLAGPPEEQRGWQKRTDSAIDADKNEPLTLEMDLSGDLSAMVSADGQAIDLVTASGARAAKYSDLKAHDATDRALPARMEVFNQAGRRGLRLVVDDRRAVWPVTIDPLLTSPAWTAESNQASSQFGFSVSTAGDVNGDGYDDVIVGANLFDNGQTDEGRAYVYLGSASGLSLTPAWTAESDQAGSRFGRAVATAGDVNGDGYADVIVGAILFDNGETDEGRAFVYLGSASGLSPTPAWTAEGNQVSADFGYYVGTAGDVNGDGYADVIVGAPLFDNGETDEGRAYLYLGSASGLSTTPAWTAEGNQVGANFGIAVGTAGDVNGDGYADVIVGAYLFDNGQVDEGRAYVYLGSPSGLSTTPAWTAESDQASALLGYSVGTAGDVNGDGYADVIVGAEAFDNGETDEGRAYVYLGSASGLSPTPAWTAEGNQVGANFAYSVSTAGDVNGDGYADVIVGAVFFDNGETDEGRAFVYLGSPSGLSTTPVWTAESDQVDGRFGRSVSTAGDVNGDGYADVIVGAPNFDNGEIDEGRAYVYLGSASGLSSTAGWTKDGSSSAPGLGVSVGTAGDVNGDGYADVIIGATVGTINTGGAAYFLRGSSMGLGLFQPFTTLNGQGSDNFGYSVGSAGDVNGDGFADVIVGDPTYDNGQTDEGAAFVYFGSSSGLSLTPNWTAESDQAFALFGYSVGSAGDVNGDGFADVIVGARDFVNGQLREGRAYVYLGSASGLSLTPNWMAESDQANASFGYSVGSAGDVNGDGFADVIVAAPNFDNGQTDEGRAYVYHGSASGLSLTPNWTAESDQAGAFFGRSVGTAGDVNGDGYADVIVGAPNFDNGQTDEGRAFVYFGSPTGLSLTPNWTAESDQAGALFGSSAGTAGDVNGDGYADVIVGAPYFDNGQTDEGRAFVYHGSASGLSLTPNWTAESDQPSAVFGSSVGTAGDVNGDGYADVVVGATSFNNFGRAFLYYGNNGRGMSLRPQQRRSDDSAAISFLGVSDGANGFRLAALGLTPYGRSRVKLEWEIKPLGSLFNGAATQTSAGWIDTGTAGASLDELVAGLSSNTVYHWRIRLRYEPARTPCQSRSRWVTVPWNGWQEADLRTAHAADLIVSQGDAADPVLFGTDLTYSISVSNSGPDAAPGVVLRDTLPAGTTFVSALPSQGTCTPPVGGVVTCNLGSLASAGQASVSVSVRPASPGTVMNTADASFTGVETAPANNHSTETTTVLPASPGDRVWLDSDRDGIQDPGEPGVAGVLVALYDGAGVFLDAVVTDASGAYVFPNQTLGATYRVRFIPPTGYFLTAKDQGADDLLDSDADPVTQLTPPFVLASVQDRVRWDAGLLACLAPDEAVFIASVTKNAQNFPVLQIQDPNQPLQVTGYNIRRSSTAAPPFSSWPLVATDVVDMDAGTPNVQWVDSTGDVSPTGIWFYQATAYNHGCPAEGPF